MFTIQEKKRNEVHQTAVDLNLPTGNSQPGMQNSHSKIHTPKSKGFPAGISWPRLITRGIPIAPSVYLRNPIKSH